MSCWQSIGKKVGRSKLFRVSSLGFRVSKYVFYFFWSWFVLVLGFRVSNLAFLSFATRYTEKNMSSPQKAGVVYEAHPTRVLLGPGALPDSFGP